MKRLNQKSKSILIVGGTGFIGYHLLIRAKQLNWKLTSISRNAPKKFRTIKGVKYLKINVSNKKDINKKLKKNFNFVLNLAGDSSGAFSKLNNYQKYKSQFIAGKNIIDFFSRKKIDKFIQIGSSSEYGAITTPHQENNKCSPKSSYGKSKLLITKYLLNAVKKYTFNANIIRLFQVYGKKQNKNKIIPFLIDKCKKNKKFDLTAGNQTRDFCYIDDVVEAIFLLLNKKKIRGEIFNIGYGQSITIKSLTKLIQKKIKKGKPNFGAIKIKKNEIKNSKASINKINKFTKWKPKIDLETGIKLLIN